ncbi:septum formation family protein [Sinosporangium siamense]|uniref:Septum formation-related domain-containing protein n=1 Tax=Sinosporangium siamense TaxID=1367973 RepID=A0A919RM37_9ACTN|nr:septum formation family protein [Sinosporangium siamense]GII96268.1 hypothetical protein Ssi02_64990 [Sinosporangium siamense]
MSRHWKVTAVLAGVALTGTSCTPAGRAVPYTEPYIQGLEVRQAGVVTSAALGIGTCHRMELPEELYNGSDVAPPVPCTEPHQTETYMVTVFTGALAAHRERPNPEQLVAAIDKACSYQPIRPYLGAGTHDGQWGVAIWGKFPTRADWAKGDRTLRCDLLGPTTAAERGPELRVPLRNIMRRRESAVVRRCRLGARDVTCAEPHHAEWVEPPAPFDPRPDVQQDMCRQNARAFRQGSLSGLTVSAEAMDGYVACWLSHKDGRMSVGTLRGGLT